jgi:hypothetical protein
MTMHTLHEQFWGDRIKEDEMGRKLAYVGTITDAYGIVFIVCNVSIIVCVALCAVFYLSVACWVLLYYHCHRVKTHLQFN